MPRHVHLRHGCQPRRAGSAPRAAASRTYHRGMDGLGLIEVVSMRGIRVLLVAQVMIALALTSGCNGGSISSDDASSGSTIGGSGGSTAPDGGGTSSGGGTEPASIPPAEPSGPEAPAGGGNSDLSVSLPQLPIGRGDDDQNGETLCLGIAYLGHVMIPPGVRIHVTDVQLTQTRQFFTLERSGCSGHPSCTAADFDWTADSVGEQCSVVIRETGTTGDDEEDRAVLGLSGRAHCPTGQKTVCANFMAGVEEEGGQTISLIVPGGSDQAPSPDVTATPEQTPDPTTPGSASPASVPTS